MSRQKIARRYVVRGRVQGVGFRYFVERSAHAIGVRGWVKNRDDGTVEVYASGTPEQLAELGGLLWQGPRFSDVRGVEELEAVIEAGNGFRIL